MIHLRHKAVESVLDELAKRSPKLTTALDVVGPIRCEGDPEVITEELLERLQTVIGVEPTDPNRDFRSGARFEVPKGFPVDQFRETLTALFKKVLNGGGEILTEANVAW